MTPLGGRRLNIYFCKNTDFDREMQGHTHFNSQHQYVLFEKTESGKNTAVLGIVSVLVIISIMIIIARKRFTLCNPYNFEIDLLFGIKLAAMFAITILFIIPYAHEFLHAIVYPFSEKKTIFLSNKRGYCLTYCEAIISKRRLLIMLVTPMTVLGLASFILLLSFAPQMSRANAIIVLCQILYNVFSSLHDIGAALVIAFGMPSNSKVFSSGHHLFIKK